MLLHSRQKCTDSSWNGADIIHSSIVHHILSIGNNRQVATAMLPRKCMKGRLRGEEGCIWLKIEVLNKRRSLGFHCNGDNYIGDHFEIRCLAVTVVRGRGAVWCK